MRDTGKRVGRSAVATVKTVLAAGFICVIILQARAQFQSAHSIQK